MAQVLPPHLRQFYSENEHERVRKGIDKAAWYPQKIPVGRQLQKEWPAQHHMATNARYDQRGNCVAETDPLGHITRYRYDTHGQVVEIIDATGKSKKLRWNPFGQSVEHIDCSGYPTRFSYDNRGYLQTITDALGERTQFSYDAQGRLLSSQLPQWSLTCATMPYTPASPR